MFPISVPLELKINWAFIINLKFHFDRQFWLVKSSNQVESILLGSDSRLIIFKKESVTLS